MYGAGTTYNGNLIGGGVGYTNIINPENANYIVSTREQLLSALSSARLGSIIYVTDSAQIDLTGHTELVIHAGVTLASGRGNGSSLGALLYNTHIDQSGDDFVQFYTEQGVRITGIRIRGSDHIYRSQYESWTMPFGIWPRHPNIEIDNCEIFDWMESITLRNMNAISTIASHIHHNKIHHNLRDGFGYGVDIGPYSDPVGQGSTALVEANIFDANRHSITSTGDTSSYIARYNIQLGYGVSHAFDVHGNGYDGTGGQAGTRFDIYNNIFYYIIDPNHTYNNGVTPQSLGQQIAVRIRGKPLIGAYIHDNFLYYNRNEASWAIYQDRDTIGNFYVSNNCFNGTTETGSKCSLEPSPQTIICAISNCPPSIIQGQTMLIQPSFSGGLAPYSVQTLRDGIPYGNPISAPNTGIGQIIIPTDSSWTIGNHLISFRITDSSSPPPLLCTTAACTITVISSVPVSTGILDVSSTPLGAEISIDNTDQKKVTRSIIQNIPKGSHSLKLTLAGYRDYITTFRIRANRTTSLTTKLIHRRR